MDEALLAQITQLILRDLPQTQAIYLYGSAVRDELRADSDIDLAVLLPHKDAVRAKNLALSPIHTDLEYLLRRDVDLVNLRLVSPILQAQVVGTGQAFYTADADASDEFAMRAYSDLQDLHRMQAELLREFRRTKRAYPV